jgi:formylglycine-generating enzyme required for sulfatase activity
LLSLLDSPDRTVWERGFGFLTLLYELRPAGLLLPEKVHTPTGAEIVRIDAGQFLMGTDEAEIPALIEWTKAQLGIQTEANPLQRLVRRIREYFTRRGREDSEVGRLGLREVDESWFENETPRHTVHLDAFWIEVHPVTVAQYAKFLDETGNRKPEYWDDERLNAPDQPVVGVSWRDASAYCEWAGVRLPTEAEWEKAARGGLVKKRFPWGDEDADKTRANYGRNVGKPTPVGQYPANGYGLYDMAGNVWEWCLDECALWRRDDVMWVRFPPRES